MQPTSSTSSSSSRTPPLLSASISWIVVPPNFWFWVRCGCRRQDTAERVRDAMSVAFVLVLVQVVSICTAQGLSTHPLHERVDVLDCVLHPSWCHLPSLLAAVARRSSRVVSVTLAKAAVPYCIGDVPAHERPQSMRLWGVERHGLQSEAQHTRLPCACWQAA